MEQRGFYTILELDNVILVRTTGKWTLALDIAYLAELSETLTTHRNKPYSVFVDMRGWQVDDSVINSKVKTKLQLDRRSQKVEHWLCDEYAQNDHLLQFFEEESFKLYRHTNRQDAQKALVKLLSGSTKIDSALEWLSQFE